MNRRLFLIALLLFAGLVSFQLWMLLRPTTADANSATLVCRASNAGIPIPEKNLRVSIYTAGERTQPIQQSPAGRQVPLPPGKYDVKIEYLTSDDRQDSWVEGIELKAGENYQGEASFEAGTLLVRARGAADKVRLQVFRSSDSSTIIATKAPGEAFLLTAGSYDIRAALVEGVEERSIQWLRGLEVKPAIRTDHDVLFQRGTVHINARNAGARIAPEDTKLTFYKAGDAQQQVLLESISGHPVEMDIGTYDVKVTYEGSIDKPSLWVRALEVKEGRASEHWADFHSGRLTMRAWLPGEEELKDFRAYVYLYRPDDHSQAVALVPAGESVLISEGTYDARVAFTRSQDQPDTWIYGCEVKAGKTETKNVTFSSGRLLLRALRPDGQEITGDNVFVEAYWSGAQVSPAGRARAGEEMILQAGVFDVRLHCTLRNCPEQWIKSVRVQPGSRVEQRAVFAHTESR